MAWEQTAFSLHGAHSVQASIQDVHHFRGIHRKTWTGHLNSWVGFSSIFLWSLVIYSGKPPHNCSGGDSIGRCESFRELSPAVPNRESLLDQELFDLRGSQRTVDQTRPSSQPGQPGSELDSDPISGYGAKVLGQSCSETWRRNLGSAQIPSLTRSRRSLQRYFARPATFG